MMYLSRKELGQIKSNWIEKAGEASYYEKKSPLKDKLKWQLVLEKSQE
ncbi:MAG: hypothetical protein ACRDHW_12940 [Ktedonobacteraceae bacterium]